MKRMKKKTRNSIIYIGIVMISITVGAFILGMLKYLYDDYIIVLGLPFDVRWFFWALIVLAGALIGTYIGINSYKQIK